MLYRRIVLISERATILQQMTGPISIVSVRSAAWSQLPERANRATPQIAAEKMGSVVTLLIQEIRQSVVSAVVQMEHLLMLVLMVGRRGTVITASRWVPPALQNDMNLQAVPISV